MTSMRVFGCVLVCGALQACAGQIPSSSKPCGDGVTFYSGEELTVSRIELLSDLASPYLYLFEGQYIIKMRPDDVADFLSDESLLGDYQALRQAIADDLPLQDNTDIKKYALEYPSLLRTMKATVAGVIESGRASMVDTYRGESGEALKEISRVHVEGCGEQRYFCRSEQHLVLYVMDSIC
jgi:hypothetical protein